MDKIIGAHTGHEERINFEITGNCMYDGTRESYCISDVLEVTKLQEWQWLGELRKNTVIIVNSIYTGLILREVVSYNIRSGEIILRSWNDPKEYPDLIINEMDLTEVYSIDTIIKNYRICPQRVA